MVQRVGLPLPVHLLLQRGGQDGASVDQRRGGLMMDERGARRPRDQLTRLAWFIARGE